MTSPRLLSNRYELGETLGYGGMSEVHHGHDVRLGREVAVKILRADLARDPQFQERFRREAQNAAALNHPAIVAVYDTGETQTEYGPLPYIVMEYVGGRTLRDIVKTEGPLEQGRAMEVMADVCAALDFSHRHGIVHRDVKPANVMITPTGAVKVMDFGIARAVHDGQSAMTQTAAVIGTAQYLSPEQARGETVDARSDVYAAGCVLYELITGDPPFTGDSPVAVAYQHVREDPEPPSAMNPQISPVLDAVVLKALAKGQANRYQSAAEMRGDLVRVLQGQRPGAPMVMTDSDRTQAMAPSGHAEDYPEDYYDAAEEQRQRSKRRKLLAALLVGLGILAVAGVMWAAGLFGAGDEAKPIPADIQGKYEAEAVQILNQAGFRNIAPKKTVPCFRQQDGSLPCDPSLSGKVVASDPKAGQKTSVTEPVTLTIGLRPENVQVPQLQGQKVDAAKATLAQRQLLVGQITEVDSDSPSDWGTVKSSQPDSDATVKQGDVIALTVYKTPKLVNAPDQRGQQFAVANGILQGLGFRVSRKDVDDAAPEGTVVNQSPVGQAPERGQITLQVSNGSKAPVSMPDLTRRQVDDAKSQLKSMGFTGPINVQEETVPDPADNGKVTHTDPTAGARVTKDAPVTLWVGKADTGGGGLFPPPSSSSSPSSSYPGGIPIPGRGGGGSGQAPDQ